MSKKKYKKVYKKANVDHFVIQLNTKGHIHKDKKKEIPRKDKYKEKL